MLLCPQMGLRIQGITDSGLEGLSLVERYGPAMGTQVFQKMWTEHKGPFGEGAKYDAEKPSVVRKVEKAGGVLPGIGVLGRDIPLPWPKPPRQKRKS